MKNKTGLIIGVMGLIALTLAACSPGVPGSNSYYSPTATPKPPLPIDAPAESPADAAAGEAGGVYAIIPTGSEARFIVGEVLNGADFSVVGVTSLVEGSITIDVADLPATTLSPIRVDMSDLKTDNAFRNGAIHSFILETGKEENRYAVFETTAISGLPETVEAGVPFDFTITGDLTIHNVTREVTFNATVTPISETRLEGIASATILYADFGISILRLPPQVASVEDEVILEITFVAERS